MHPGKPRFDILIMGAGAIGSVFGGMLAAAGHKVALVGRKPHMDAIRAGGLKITGLFGDRVVGSLETAESADAFRGRRFDLVLVTVKSYDTANAAREVAPLVGPDTLVISLQNGLGNYEILRDGFGAERSLAGRVIFGVEVPKPGHVDVTVYAEPVMVGNPEGAVDFERVNRIASAFAAAGIPSEPTTEISKFIWAKVLYNCSLNPLSAILGVPYGRLLDGEPTRAIMRRVVREIFDVAAARGVELFWNRPEQYTEVLFGRLIPDTAAHHASMLQDIRAGRRTEIEALNGAVVRLGEEVAVPCAVNQTLSDIIRALEAGGHGTFDAAQPS